MKKMILLLNSKKDKHKDILQAIILGFLSGLGTMLAFPMFHLSYFAFFSFILLFIAIEIFSIVPAIVAMTVYVITFYCYLLNWIEFFHPLALPCIIITLSVYHAIVIMVYHFLRKNTKNPSIYNPILLSWLMITLEYMRNVGFLRFNYGNIAYSQFEFLPFIQISEITGYLGVSFFIYLCNAFFAQWIIHFSFFLKKWESPNGIILWKNLLFNRFAIIFYIFITILSFGFSRIHFLNNLTEVKENLNHVQSTSKELFQPLSQKKINKDNKSTKKNKNKFLNVALIQPWFDYNMPWNKKNKQLLLDKLFSLTDEVAKKSNPDLIVWPETTIMCSYIYELKKKENEYCLQYKKYFENFAKHNSSRFLAGALGLEEKKKSVPFTKKKDSEKFSFSPKSVITAKSSKTKMVFDGFLKYNAAVFSENDGTPIAMHGKKLLVPFAEYFPYEKLLEHMEWLQKIFEKIGASNFTPFEKYTVFFHEQMPPFGTMICYEDCFPDPAHTMTLGGAKFLIIITNDAWSYSEKSQVQHYIFSVFRAIENRRPILRVGNAGITGLIQATGLLQHQIPQFQEGYALFSFYPLDGLSIYNTLGSNTINILMLLFLCGYLPYVYLSYFIKKNRKKKKIK